MDAPSGRLARWRAWLTHGAEGQGMMEYALILTAVAVVVVIALFAIGPKVASMFQNAGASLSSDRRSKASFAAVDSLDVLARVVSLRIATSTPTSR
jgi:Flp pilus assembly pilin Flp